MTRHFHTFATSALSNLLHAMPMATARFRTMRLSDMPHGTPFEWPEKYCAPGDRAPPHKHGSTATESVVGDWRPDHDTRLRSPGMIGQQEDLL